MPRGMATSAEPFDVKWATVIRMMPVDVLRAVRCRTAAAHRWLRNIASRYGMVQSTSRCLLDRIVAHTVKPRTARRGAEPRRGTISVKRHRTLRAVSVRAGWVSVREPVSVRPGVHWPRLADCSCPERAVNGPRATLPVGDQPIALLHAAVGTALAHDGSRSATARRRRSCCSGVSPRSIWNTAALMVSAISAPSASPI
jgi:hypothetical protein